MIFVMGIRCDNAAFEDEPRYEVARILRDLAERVEEGGNYFPLRDSQSNDGPVGAAEFRRRYGQRVCIELD